MKAIFRLWAVLAMLSSATAMAAESPNEPAVNRGAFTQYYSFTTVSNYSPTSPVDTLKLTGATSQFSGLSFQLLTGSGQSLTSPASLSTFAATKQGKTWNATFNDRKNADLALTGNTTYLLRVTGVASQNNVKYSLLGNQIKAGTFVPAVPEPGAYAMLIAGFGLIAAMTRQRRKA